MTLDEYMEFEKQSPDRHEYVNGIAHAMNGPSVAHARIAGELFVAVHRRAENWRPDVYRGPQSVAELQSIALSVPLAQIYAGTLPAA
jgi:Uma2 family endonuclease